MRHSSSPNHGSRIEKQASPSGPMKTLLRWLHHGVNELKVIFLIRAQKLPITIFVASSNLFPGGNRTEAGP
ncbi:hypothetical protein IMY05_012G0010300 [Salix suchowensis]|nr:hypothetical protein IMY05_012G0010300 [Salix suchowensis]